MYARICKLQGSEVDEAKAIDMNKGTKASYCTEKQTKPHGPTRAPQG